MKSKKIAGVVITVGLAAIICVVFKAANVKGFFTSNVEQNVVYTNEDSTEDSKESYSISNDEKEGYKEKSSEVLNKYFNILPKDDESLHFQAFKFDKKALEEMQSQSKGGAEKTYEFFIQKVQGVKHGLISTEWGNEDKDYLVVFNEDTKEVDFVIVNGMQNAKSQSAEAFTEDKIKNTAEEFIKQNKLGDIENPKFMIIKDEYIFYEDENDENKKVEIGINASTGEVKSFAVKEYAQLEYEEKVNRK